MNRIALAAATTLAAAALTIPAGSAEAAPACPTETMTPAERSQIHAGMLAADVWSIVGHPYYGEYRPSESTPTTKVFRWDACSNGVVSGSVRIAHVYSAPARSWVVSSVY